MIPIGTGEDQHECAGWDSCPNPAHSPRRGLGYRDEAAVLRARIRSIELEAATFGDLLALELLVEIANDLKESITSAGAAIRAGGASYGQLGDAAGISRQAARKRFEP